MRLLTLFLFVAIANASDLLLRVSSPVCDAVAIGLADEDPEGRLPLEEAELLLKSGVMVMPGVIGEGWYGTAWRGVRERDGKLVPVVIKTIKNPEHTEAFKREYRYFARVYPHTAIWVTGERSRPFLVMEEPEGDPGAQALSVQDRLRRNLGRDGYFHGDAFAMTADGTKVPLRDSAKVERLVRSFLVPVRRAHQVGVIHRDIHRGNVTVTYVDGEPVSHLIDFGEARAHGSLTDSSFASTYDRFVGGAARERTDVQALQLLMLETILDSEIRRARGWAERALPDGLHKVETEPSPPPLSFRKVEVVPGSPQWSKYRPTRVFDDIPKKLKPAWAVVLQGHVPATVGELDALLNAADKGVDQFARAYAEAWSKAYENAVSEKDRRLIKIHINDLIMAKAMGPEIFVALPREKKQMLLTTLAEWNKESPYEKALKDGDHALILFGPGPEVRNQISAFVSNPLVRADKDVQIQLKFFR